MRKGTRRSNKNIVKSKSSPTLRERKESSSTVSANSASKEDDQDVDEIGLHPTDLNLIKKLSKRVNVLPVSLSFVCLCSF